MATIRKRPTGKYEAQVRIRGCRARTKSFRRKQDAERWARHIEDKMTRSVVVDYSLAERFTVADIVQRYATEILPSKRSCRQESSRVRELTRRLGYISLARLSSLDLSQYRDERLKQVAAQTVIHELGLLNRALKSATLDWGIVLPNGSIPGVRKPERSRGRDRRPSGDELEKLLDRSDPVMCILIQFAIETGMRRGELAGLVRSDVCYSKRTILVRHTKNGETRFVPLSTKAVSLLKNLPISLGGSLFAMSPHRISRMFLKACRSGGISDLRFHDLRHEACSRLFEKGLNPIEVSAISGHKTLQMLKRYTHLRAEDLVKKLG